MLEQKLAVALMRCGVAAWANLGVVVPDGTYRVHVVKPDAVVPDLRVAIEIDHRPTRQPSRHELADGIGDDRLRDQVLGSVGWKVLRIRRPGAVVVGGWPWRIETTSQTPTVLARLVIEQLDTVAISLADRVGQ